MWVNVIPKKIILIITKYMTIYKIKLNLIIKKNWTEIMKTDVGSDKNKMIKN